MNKTAVIIAVAAHIIGGGVGFSLGFAIGRNRPGNPPVQSQQDPVAVKLEAAVKAAEEISRRSAAEAEAFKTFARRRTKDLNRLDELNSYQRLSDSEKIEIGEIIDRIAADFPKIRKDYVKETGRVKYLSEWVLNIKEADRKTAIRLLEKSVDDAKFTSQKRIERLKYSIDHMKFPAR